MTLRTLCLLLLSANILLWVWHTSSSTSKSSSDMEPIVPSELPRLKIAASAYASKNREGWDNNRKLQKNLCYLVSDFESEQQARRVASHLADVGWSVDYHLARKSVKTSTWVYVGPYGQRDKANYHLKRIGLLGLRQAHLIESGPHQNAIFVDNYNDEGSLDNAIALLETLNLEARTQPQFKIQPTHELRVRGQQGSEKLHAVLGEILPASREIAINNCGILDRAYFEPSV